MVNSGTLHDGHYTLVERVYFEHTYFQASSIMAAISTFSSMAVPIMCACSMSTTRK